MGRHEKAWAGLNILVFGKTPMLPMKIEQAISSASPANEIRVDSFEDYDDAYDFSKARTNVGFIILTENCGGLPIDNVFRQLSRPYEERGWPVFGALVYEGKETFVGLRTVQKLRNILCYLPVSAILESSQVASTLDDIWSKFTDAFEEAVIPVALQRTFLSIASPSLSSESVRFISRVSTLLCSNLNVSWIDQVAIRWGFVVESVRSLDPKAIEPHASLERICKLAHSDTLKNAQVPEIIASSETLCARIAMLSSALNVARIESRLSEELQKAAAGLRPGGPALLRQLTKSRDQIVRIAEEEAAATARERAG
jgi:hypothetical protein